MGDSLTFRSLEPGEGARLVRCIERCYGETHVDPTLYDAEAIDAQLASGARHAAVALTPDGEVAAHLGLALRREGDNTADTGLTMVDPRFRGQGLAHRLAIEVGRIAIELGLVALHDYPVTVHGGTQRLGTDRAVGVGFLLDNMPADVEFNEMGNAAARATPSLVRYIPLGEAPRREVYLPASYRDLARDLYARARLARTLLEAPATDEAPGPEEPELEVHSDARRGMVKLFAHRLGGSAAAFAQAVAKHASASGPTQLDLPLDDPRVLAVVSPLRDDGFFFAALLPEFHRGDRLRLQRLPRKVGPDEVPDLESDALHAIAEFVVRDGRA